MFFRKRAWQSKFTFCNAVTQTDALSACQKAAKECQLGTQQEAPGSLLLTPGFAGKAEAWKRASKQAFGGLSAALADEPSSSEKSLLQSQVRMPRGLGLSQIRVDIRPGDATSEGVIVEVTSCNIGQFQAFVTALGERIDERFAHNPGAHGCAGRLEDFLAEALPADIADKKKIKQMCRKKSLHDWYAAKVTVTNFQIGGDPTFGGTATVPMDRDDEDEDSEEDQNTDAVMAINMSAQSRSDESFKERKVRGLTNWYAEDTEAMQRLASDGVGGRDSQRIDFRDSGKMHMWESGSIEARQSDPGSKEASRPQAIVATATR